MKVASKPVGKTLTKSSNRSNSRFLVMTAASLQFVVFTVLAMWLYPGGLLTDDSTVGYDFFRNFFSDLGMTITYSGESKWLTAALFTTALTLGGLGIVYFFALSPALFRPKRTTHILAILGSIFGFVSGVCFIGVAWTPSNLLGEPHGTFVQIAFVTLLFVVIFYSAAIWLTPDYSNGYVTVYGIFAISLIGYIYLLFWGPSAQTDSGLIIQATGQKIVVYAAIVCMLIQSIGAWRLDQR